ncbi:ABC transporter permease [Tessaracoccus caeni]|uniref:ABC transporter permease n=1 Tax=Tessaracoccus caeni TaxID=3031239 RepID=UPI0023DC711A|nr:ABC-2 family transporter protein [Tessaracoccus caeni]MDF1489576.1 ABC-2 family transporter protein [Tessaracoccus caeni]
MNRTSWPAVRGCVRNAVKTSWAYRIDLVTAVTGLFIQVWLLTAVWRAVYGGAGEVRGVEQSQAVSYAVLAACLQVALMPWEFSGLDRRVRTGQVGVDMMRPLGLVGQVFAQNVGTLLARLPIAVIGIVWAVLIGALSLPPRLDGVGLWLLATVLGATITLLMNLLMSMACFWSLEIGGYRMLYRLGSGLLSGALIPLWFMPGWLAGALDWLPFRAQMFTPLSIYFGSTTGPAAWLAIGAQAGWIVVIVVLLRVVWRRAERKVVIFGG